MKKDSGYTLIEVLIYLGLFTIIMTGLLISTLNLLEGYGRLQTKVMVQEEGNFLLAKINALFTGAASVSVPTSGSTGNELGFIKDGESVTFIVNAGNLQLTRFGFAPVTLNNSNVSLLSTPPIFYHNGSGNDPEYVRVIFTLTSKTPGGQTYNQEFSATKYLRK